MDLTACRLLEIAGRAKEAAAEYEILVKARGDDKVPGVSRTVRQECLKPRYRLNLQLGRPRLALKLWREMMKDWAAMAAAQDAKALKRLHAFGEIEECALIADRLKDYKAAGKRLIEIEAELRKHVPQAARKPSSEENSYEGLLYRHCVHEMRRVARISAASGKPVRLPVDLPKLRPFDWSLVLKSPRAVFYFLILVHEQYRLRLPMSSAGGVSPLREFFSALACRTPSRTLRAAYSYAAALLELQRDKPYAAQVVKALELCADTDTMVAPLAAMALARFGVSAADAALRRAAAQDPSHARHLQNLRKRLSKELEIGQVKPLPAR